MTELALYARATDPHSRVKERTWSNASRVYDDALAKIPQLTLDHIWQRKLRRRDEFTDSRDRWHTLYSCTIEITVLRVTDGYLVTTRNEDHAMPGMYSERYGYYEHAHEAVSAIGSL